MASGNRRMKKLKKVTEKLEREAAIAKEEVVPLTDVVGKTKKTATQAVEDSKPHAQVAVSLQDRLDPLTSRTLEEHGKVPDACFKGLTTPRRG